MVAAPNQPTQSDSRYRQMWMHERNRRIEVEQENIRLRKIVYNTKFSPMERMVAIEIADQVKEAKHTDTQGRKLVNQTLAADKLEVDRSTIHTAMKVLEQSGFIADKDTSSLKDAEGKKVRGKDGNPIYTTHLSLDQNLLEDFSLAERATPRKIKENRKKPVYTCRECGTDDITIKETTTIICKNPNCKKCGHEVFVEASYTEQKPTNEQEPDTEEETSEENLYSAENFNTIELLDESNSAPPLEPTSADPVSILKEWIQKRRGTPRIIQATGQSEVARKYISKPETYEPDIEAFIAGKVVYGSRLNNPETGLTQVICFECDTPEHSEIAMNSMSALARAGISAICHERQRERAHFEVYFDQPVGLQVAYQMLLEIDPDLAEIPEVFPCKAKENRTNHPLSWPMWQRIGGQVYACKAMAILPAPHDGAMREVDPSDLEAMAQLVTDAVTPASLVEEFAVVLQERMEEERLNEQTREQERAGMGGGAIGITPKPIIQFQGDDLIPQVLAEFDAQHSWDDIAIPCGGMEEGRFCATWRGSVSRSVVIDPRNDRYAHDYGQVGSFRAHFDKHQAWCYIHRKDRTEDLAERCAQLRREQIRVVKPEAPAAELFPTEQQPVYYTPCIVCSKPKSVLRADGVSICGTQH